MANRWENNENSELFYFLGLQNYCRWCSHEIKRCFLLGRKALTNLDRIWKSRGITLPTKVYLVKAMVFPVVMYGCESWTMRKAEPQRTDAFELWCWRRLSRVPWTARRSSQLILKEVNSEYSLEGLVGSPWSPRGSQESPPTPQFKSINSLALSFLHSSTLTSIHDHWKNHSLD